jgi:hypothetical protein
MNTEQLEESELTGEAEVLVENLAQFRFFLTTYPTLPDL